MRSLFAVTLAGCLAACVGSRVATGNDAGMSHDAGPTGPDGGAPGMDAGPNPIQHVFIIFQENRSFDHYFGTYPGADGIPTLPDGGFAPCLPQLDGGPCVGSFHAHADVNAGGPHGSTDATADIHGGAMDGFVIQQEASASGCAPGNPTCSGDALGVARHDVMGFHNGDEIPNYWRYAQAFVLQDHLYQSNASWSLPSHLFLVSGRRAIR